MVEREWLTCNGPKKMFQFIKCRASPRQLRLLGCGCCRHYWRLHTDERLREELKKVVRVVGKRRSGAPHESLLVLDATVGQNAVRQAQAFAAAVPLTGLVITKLDGTAKGGSVVALRRAVPVPIRFLGTGETLEDLEAFDPVKFAHRLVSE